MKAVVENILSCMSLNSVDELKTWLADLLGEKEVVTKEEIEKFASIAIKAKNIANCPVKVTEEQLVGIYTKSMIG